MTEPAWRLFERYGVEIEYMIVSAEDLAVASIADRLLAPDGEEPENEIVVGDVAWSNELALHVLEMKTPDGPATTFDGLIDAFQNGVQQADRLLEPDARLLPTGMHPFMDPLVETRLWPHEYSPVYRAFDRIFDCRGHGWSNLQSAHLNLPFAGDDEFERLHAAIRFLLPILPALAAASPIVEGSVTPWLDARMAYYRDNAQRIPSVAGLVVPEAVRSEEEYRDRILRPIHADLAKHDPEGTLAHEWVNARGAIARFDRGAIEIRVLDTQECPVADLAILALTTNVLRALCDEVTASSADLNAIETERLGDILTATIENGDHADITDAAYLRLLGFETASPIRADRVWQRLTERFAPEGHDALRWHRALDTILAHGCLARRILSRLPKDPSQGEIREVYFDLADCLSHGTQLS